MSDICMHTQKIISEVYDKATVPAEELSAVKEHCASCPQCAAFVSGLAQLRKTSSPAAPEHVVEATLTAVRAESARMEQQARARERADADAASSAVPTRLSPQETPAAGGKGALPRIGPFSFGWVAAAAVIVLATVFATGQGVRYIMDPPQAAMDGGYFVEESSPDDASLRSESLLREDSAADATEPTHGAYGAQDVSTSGVSYILLNGLVYRVSDRTQAVPASDDAIGTVLSDLGTGEATGRTVYSTALSTRVLVEGPDNRTWEADLITRTLDNATFALQSGPINEFGTWPSLPAGFSTPENPDGSPSFEAAGTDDRSVPIFVPPGRSPSAGFAVGPGTGSSDPAAGNPGWTWWTPYR